MKSSDHGHSSPQSFLALLIGDVIAARQRLELDNNPTARRDVVRASMAAMEGITWIMREHVRATLDGLDELTPIVDLALREVTYVVTQSGKVMEQSRGLPLATSIRLVAAQAKSISPGLEVNFAASGWHDLQRSVAIRNRITHPKPDQDLAISDGDLGTIGSAVSWLVATADYVMASMNIELVRYNDDLRDISQRLAAGDPEALAEYEAALREMRTRGLP